MSTEARCGPATGLLLVYFTRVTSATDDKLPLSPEEIKKTLVIPPKITNRQGWLRGYYKTVQNVSVDDRPVLPQHCFEGVLPGRYFNEFYEAIPERIEPCGTGGVAAYFGLAEYIESKL